VAIEAIDHQPANGATAAGDPEPVGAARLASVQLDKQYGIVTLKQGIGRGARLGVAVNDHWISNSRQDRLRSNCMDSVPWDRELDGIEPGVPIRVLNRPAE
jgi:hypothetical protein